MIPQNKTAMDIAKNRYFTNLPFFKEEKAQKFMSIALTLLALSFFGFFAISPTLSTIAKLRKEIKDNEFVNSQLEKKIRDLNTLKLQYASLQSDLPIVFESLPKKADVPTLIAKIQSIAKSSNITVKKIQNFEVEVVKNNKEINNKYYSYAFSIEGGGTYEDISRFISTLTNMQRIVSVEILFLRKPAIQDDPSIKFSINAMAFIKE